MKSKYTHARTCVYNINYHIVWCVKYRRKVLSHKISSRLYEIISSVAAEKGFSVIECKTGDNDHVHCFVSAPPKLAVTQIVKYLKGTSGNTLLKEFPVLRKYLFKATYGMVPAFVKPLARHRKKISCVILNAK